MWAPHAVVGTAQVTPAVKVSYNLRKMVANGYLTHERSVHDRRSIHVRLTEKGANVTAKCCRKPLL
jgi:DNA-binding MarR family transcriptional regulator